MKQTQISKREAQRALRNVRRARERRSWLDDNVNPVTGRSGR